jgi:hypothetical protein
MRDVRAAIIARLKADPDIAALVGTEVHKTSFPIGATFPCITVSYISDIDDVVYNTGSAAHMRIQCSSFAKQDWMQLNLSKLIKDSLHLMHDTVLTYGTSETVKVMMCVDLGSIDGNTQDELSTASATGLFIDHRDFRIFYDPN